MLHCHLESTVKKIIAAAKRAPPTVHLAEVCRECPFKVRIGALVPEAFGYNPYAMDVFFVFGRCLLAFHMTLTYIQYSRGQG